MYSQLMCSVCGRQGGHLAQGAAINSLGCTGESHRWAARVIKNPSTIDAELYWGMWNGVKPAVVACFQLFALE